MAGRSADIIGASSFVKDFDEANTCPSHIFEKPYVDYSISQGFTQEYFPINALTNEGKYLSASYMIKVAGMVTKYFFHSFRSIRVSGPISWRRIHLPSFHKTSWKFQNSKNCKRSIGRLSQPRRLFCYKQFCIQFV